MTEQFPGYRPFDPVRYLQDDEDMEIYLQDALASGDAPEIADALGVAARAKGRVEDAVGAGLPSGFVQRTGRPDEPPSWPVPLNVFEALGFALTPVTVKPAA